MLGVWKVGWDPVRGRIWRVGVQLGVGLREGGVQLRVGYGGLGSS